MSKDYIKIRLLSTKWESIGMLPNQLQVQKDASPTLSSHGDELGDTAQDQIE